MGVGEGWTGPGRRGRVEAVGEEKGRREELSPRNSISISLPPQDLKLPSSRSRPQNLPKKQLTPSN